MYETRIFADGKTFFEWAQKNVRKSIRANDMVGWNGAINYINLDRDLVLLYQLEKTDGGKGWTVCGLHMLLWGAQETLRKDVCKISEFYRPAGSVLWHASVVYGGRSPMDFCVANAFQAEGYEKYSKGGNFTMTFAGLGDYLECMNDRGVIRFYEGNPVDEERSRKNDPTIDHADMVASELRALNPGCRDEEPALAEFSGVVEACKTVKICGVKCYRIRLMSGPPDNPSSFPWSLLVAANRIDGKYVPRVGDSVHGAAYMFGTFHGEAQEAPTVYQDRGLQEIVEKAAAKESVEQASEGKPDDGSSETVSGKPSDEEITKGWEWLPRKPKDYPVVRAHGGGLAKSVATTLPKYVVYSEYRKRIKGELKALKDPSRKELKRILDSIDYVITSKDNLHMFGSVMDAIGIRHFVVDAKTGERHLWCGLPSGFGREHFLSNLLVALDKDGNVLRYTFYMGDWDWHRLDRGMETQINFHTEKDLRYYDSIGAAIKDVPKMGKDDFIIACCLGHTAMLQAYCDEVVDGVQQFTIEWQIHYLPWQFYISKGTREQLVSMLEEFDRHGIEPVETMARWKWCKMKGNT